MTFDDDYRITLQSGRSFYAYGFILGLRADELAGLTYGSDGDVEFTAGGTLEAEDERPFTPDERKEIAAAMIQRWQEWATVPPRIYSEA